MHRLLKGLLAATGLRLLNHYLQAQMDLLKIRLTAGYVKGVLGARRFAVIMILTALCLLLLATGFIFAHVGFFLWAPWEPRLKALILLALGLIYMLAAMGWMAHACSEKTWLKLSGAEKLLAETAQGKKD